MLRRAKLFFILAEVHDESKEKDRILTHAKGMRL